MRVTISTALVVTSGIAFAAFPLLRPWGDKTGNLAEAAQAFASPYWVAAHCTGMVAWVSLLGTLAAASRTPAARRTTTVLALGVAGILPFYGAEAFALHALGSLSVSSGDLTHLQAEPLIRYGWVQLGIFGVGLVLAAVAAVRLAIAEWRAHPRPWVVMLVAATLATYLPQFMAPSGIRIAHGALLGAALIGWGLTAPSRNHPAGDAPRSTRTPTAHRIG